MKTFSTLVLLVLFQFSGQSQTEKLVAVFEDAQKIWVSGTEQSTSEFSLKAGEEQIKLMQEQAQDLGKSFNLRINPVPGTPGRYTLRMGFPGVSEIAYLHKMMVFFGIGSYSINGTIRPIDELIQSQPQ